MAEGAMDDLSKAVLAKKADLGVIFDADGDRVFFVDDKGRPVIPDAAIFLLAKDFKGSVVLSVNVGILARELLTENRRKIIDSRVGHYFVKKIIKGKKINFAAEISGHYYFKFEGFSARGACLPDRQACLSGRQGPAYWDSGIFAAIEFMNQVSRLKEARLAPKRFGAASLSEWIDSLPKYFRSGELNFEVKNKEEAIKKIETCYKNRAKKISHLDGLTMEGGPPAGEWRFNLRPSNTEDLLRLNLEAKDKIFFEENIDQLKKLF